MPQGASHLREIRTQLGLSQSECATALGVAVETFRTWDAGRRPAPGAIVGRAQALKAKLPGHDRVPLQIVANDLHVHVRTLRAAVHDGRWPQRSALDRISGSLPRRRRERPVRIS